MAPEGKLGCNSGRRNPKLSIQVGTREDQGLARESGQAYGEAYLLQGNLQAGFESTVEWAKEEAEVRQTGAQ